MSNFLIIVLASWLAGFCAFIGGYGGWLARGRETEGKQEVSHFFIALGGGILVAAVAFALLPPGIEDLSPAVLLSTFCAGGLIFCLLDVYLGKRGGANAQFMAMLLDFLPEALALGAVFGHDRRLGILLAAFIGAQNLPEGFNSYREVTKSGMRPRVALTVLAAASLLGPLAAGCGYVWLRDESALTAGIMAFAGGGIMYLIFQDIAPQAKMARHWAPTLGAVLGFAIGLLGKTLIG